MPKRSRLLEWLKAHVNHKGDVCLIWPFGRDNHGYGMVGVFELTGERKIKKANTVMCRLAHGDPPTPKHEAAHSCGKGHEGCVHPEHLSWKTRAENAADAVRHGRYGFNPAGQHGKLKPSEASEIKALAGLLTNIELGLIYKVHAETIAKIRRGQTWRKVA
jgi:hypothetical protein